MPGSPATPALLRELNERTVLEAIRRDHPLSRSDVARSAGLSKPTVSLALESLLGAGLVRATGVSRGRPGRGAQLYEPVAAAGLVLGLDIGGRFVRAAIADLAGEVLARQDRRLRRRSTAAALAAAQALAAGLRARVEGEVVAAVCGAPAVIDPVSGRTWLAGAIDDLEGVDVGRELGERLGLRVAVENDVNLAALGEQAAGVARGVADFAFLSIGSGMGAALVLGGELHRGHRGAAGEVDLVPLRHGPGPAGPIDPCAAGIEELVERLAAAGTSTALAAPFSVPVVFAAARAGDPLAATAVAETGRSIAAYVAAIAAVADPELVVLGGGIGANGDLLLGPVRDELARLLPRPPRVAASTLGDGAVLAGALATGRRSALDHVFVNRTIRERGP